LDSTSLAEDLVKKVKKELKELLHKYKREKNHVNNVNVLALLGSPNKNIPALSKFVKIKYSESMGRSLFVSTDVHPGKNKIFFRYIFQVIYNIIIEILIRLMEFTR